jgi:hypothetical protein
LQMLVLIFKSISRFSMARMVSSIMIL